MAAMRKLIKKTFSLRVTDLLPLQTVLIPWPSRHRELSMRHSKFPTKFPERSYFTLT